MKLQHPFLLCICLAFVLYCSKKAAGIAQYKPLFAQKYKLIVNRGAFHCDGFELVSDRIKFLPEQSANNKEAKYNRTSETKLDTIATKEFFQEIEKRGFWKLKERYKTTTSCTSELVITLEKDGKIKTVICDDFERNCPNLIKYIDKKVVELEGNRLKRIYLPG